MQAVIRSSDHEDAVNRLNSELQRLQEREKQQQEEEKSVK